MGFVLQPNVPDVPRAPIYTGPGWNLAQRVTFRFALVYLLLYILPFPISAALNLVVGVHDLVVNEDTDPTGEPPPFVKNVVEPVEKYVLKPYEDFWDEVVLRTGRKVFDKEIEYRPLGSGDTTWNYVQLFVFAVLSAAVTILWTLAAWVWWRVSWRSRLGYPHLHEWLRVLVRFYLAFMMASYGSAKVIKLQFMYPPPDSLLHTYGESSPMHLLWTFMGASDQYTWFTGMGELIAGLLLCTRRTTLLGSLVTFAVMVHVVALNFCYDVPVKLFSSHLVLMAVFLMAPDLPWMARVFVLGQRAAPRGYTPLARSAWLGWTLFVVRSLIVLTYLAVTFHGAHEQSKLRGRLVPEPPLYGLWEVEQFTVDGVERPPLTTDAGRWQRVAIQKAFRSRKSQPDDPIVVIRNMPGKVVLIGQGTVNEANKTITVFPRPGGAPGGGLPRPTAALRYTEPEPDVIVVEGLVIITDGGKSDLKPVTARLRHYGNDKFLLSSRGFHWINEWPYNQYGPKNEKAPTIPPPPKRP